MNGGDKTKMKTNSKKQVLGTIISAVLFFSVFAVTMPGATGATITVPDDYPTIQQAVNAANAGDTVYVKQGTYYEHVVIDKSLTLLGEGSHTTIIDGGGTSKPIPYSLGQFESLYVSIALTADGITMSGFTVRNTGNGYPLFSICLLSSKNSISGNIVTLSDSHCIGVFGEESVIAENEIYSNNGYGIGLFLDSRGNKITGNTLWDNGRNIRLRDNSNENIISGNICKGSSQNGIMVSNETKNNIICGNVVSNNVQGININSNNVVYGNDVIDNDQGIVVDGQNNKIYHNNVINNGWNNGYQAKDNGTNNEWDNGYPSGGNYWSDYTGVDVYRGVNQDILGSDGIGDTPYIVDGNKDHYPLMEPWTNFPQKIHTSNNDNITPINQSIQPLASFNISIAKSLHEKAAELSEELTAKNTVPADVKEKIEMAAEYIEKAEMYYTGQNYIAANYWATRAITLLKEVIETLENLETS